MMFRGHAVFKLAITTETNRSDKFFSGFVVYDVTAYDFGHGFRA